MAHAIPVGILYFVDWTGLDWTRLVKRGLVKRGLVKRKKKCWLY